VWGIGPKLAARLRRDNIKRASDLVACQDDWVRHNYGIVGLRIKYELLGLSSMPFEAGDTDRKGISSTRSFGTIVYSFADLRSSIIKHLQIATRKLRRQGSVAGKISIFIRTGKHRSGSQYYGKTYEVLMLPTDNVLHLNSLIDEMLSRIYRPNIAYYRSGVLLSDIQPAREVRGQLQFMDDGESQFNHRTRTTELLDRMQNLYGQNILRPACIPSNPAWLPKSQNKSYSQSLAEKDRLPVIKLDKVEGYCRRGTNL